MAIKATHKETEFAVGDIVAVHQKVNVSADKSRTQIFEGMVIGIKNKGNGKSITVRRVGAQNIGIEQIIPLISPNLEKIVVKRKGGRGTRRAKLYYTREKSKREIEKLYSRNVRRETAKAEIKTTKSKAKKVAKKPVKKATKTKPSSKKSKK
jgi:large subunit ribosomal protein L19